VSVFSVLLRLLPWLAFAKLSTKISVNLEVAASKSIALTFKLCNLLLQGCFCILHVDKGRSCVLHQIYLDSTTRPQATDQVLEYMATLDYVPCFDSS
jgi:hypothetical protein